MRWRSLKCWILFRNNNLRRAEIAAILTREAEAIAKYQDKDGLWFDIVDLPNRAKNYHESSCAAMFVYALAKGVRQENLPDKFCRRRRKAGRQLSASSSKLCQMETSNGTAQFRFPV